MDTSEAAKTAGDITVRLTAIEGPASGSSIVVDREISLGRDAANAVSISDALLSRRHCVFRRTDSGQVEVQDVGSANGTFVNGEPVELRRLLHGDRVTVGESELLVLFEGQEASAETAVEFDDRELAVTATVQLREKDSLFLQPERLDEALPKSARVARDFSSVLRIITTVSGLRGSAAIQSSLAELLLEAVPAERCAILSMDSVKAEPRTAVVRDRRSGVTGPMKISRSVVLRTVREEVGTLISGEEQFDQIGQADSVVASGARSILCVPLKLHERSLGAIYLDTTKRAVAFDEGHLQLVTAVASIAAGALANAYHGEWLEEQTKLLQADLQIEHNMVGDSHRLRQVHDFIRKAAPTESTVLLMGESGTGKELVARAVHRHSPRAARPFVAINCAVLSETFLESELFGHERGAFTGALVQKRGKLEVADGGTLFLDEVGELALGLQAKLLRVLQEREFERLGGTRVLKADVRVVAATNRDLLQASKGGTFRSDLYYRLNVLTMVLPPLRERAEDIPLLASHFAFKHSKKCNRHIVGVLPEALAYLVRYNWPGNIRELENAIERAVVVGTTDVIRPEDLPDAVLESQEGPAGPSATTLTYHGGVREVKKQLITRAVTAAHGKITEAARLLDVHPNYLHMLIKNLGLRETLKK